MTQDEKWMRRALALAERGRGHVHPNPMVGAVVVQGNRIVGEGWHRAYGEPHAEVEALDQAGLKSFGATLYVTLEPCRHWGKTPPCTEAILRSGVRRVVVAHPDPHPRASGGARLLQRKKMLVETGLLAAEAADINRAFFWWVHHRRPYVTLKLATSLDGRSKTLTGESQWITGIRARQQAHWLRAQNDAVAVGAGTVIADNPSLTSHGRGRNPIRIIFAGRRTLPKRANVFDDAAPTWVIRVGRPSNFGKALKELSEKGVGTLLVEGGPTLMGSFLEAGAVDEVAWFTAPLILGESKKLRDAWRLKSVTTQRFGDDILWSGRVHRNH